MGVKISNQGESVEGKICRLKKEGKLVGKQEVTGELRMNGRGEGSWRLHRQTDGQERMEGDGERQRERSMGFKPVR